MNYEDNLPRFLTEPDPDLFREGCPLVLDFETTNLDKGDPVNPDNRLVLACWKFEGVHKSARFTEFEQDELLNDIERADFIVAHNAKFELGWLKRCGADLKTIIPYCTQAGEYILQSNRNWGGLDLDSCLARRGLGQKDDVVKQMIKMGICPSEIPAHWLKRYCQQDVELTAQLYRLQHGELLDQGQERVFYTRCLLLPVLTDIEFNGLCLDPDKLPEYHDDLQRRLAEVTRRLEGLTKGINPRSGPQVAKFLFEDLGFAIPKDFKRRELRTPTGRPRTDEATLGLLKATTPEQREFLDAKRLHSKLDAEYTKAIHKMQLLVEARDPAILYASFNPYIANTLRLTSSGKPPYNIQVQNIDRNHKVFFRARNPGWKIGEADEATLEFRTAGELSHDERIMQDIAEAFDVHTFSLETIRRAGQRVANRTAAKPFTFKPLYGGTSGTKAERAYYSAFKQRYSTLTDTQDKWISDVLTAGSLTVPTGHIFYFGSDSKTPVRVSASGYIENNQKVRDYPIQYLATGEIVPIGLIHAWHLFQALELKSFLVGTVHDSIHGEIHPDEGELFRNLMVYSLEEAPKTYLRKLYGIELQIPLKADITLTTHWGLKT